MSEQQWELERAALLAAGNALFHVLGSMIADSSWQHFKDDAELERAMKAANQWAVLTKEKNGVVVNHE